MDRMEKDMGWEDVGIAQGSSAPSGVPSGSMAAPSAAPGLGGAPMAAGVHPPQGAAPGAAGDPLAGLPVDAVTGAMIGHFQQQIFQGGLSVWPQFIQSSKRYFNVTHGYVLRKVLWQLVPMPAPKRKSTDGELGGEKDWTSRLYEGLEVDIEEPDLYVPLMSFVTYTLLCGVISGLQDKFQPDVLSATVMYAFTLLILELVLVKAVLAMSGAAQAPMVDLAAILSYKYLYLSLQLIAGLFLGFGGKPSGFFYRLITFALTVSCGVALYMVLRKLPRMQSMAPQLGQECVSNLHKFAIQGLPFLQAAVCYLLLPTWPKAREVAVVAAASVVAPAAAAVSSTIAPAIVEAAVNTTLSAVAAAADAA
eukprot:TRINITY_DN65454_c0_g1_i1.p1 TRINITY_DN65454_c0_g1~~TRINITY_DN65454_c0_g1_i1.p1  ORF type:complete len:364 (+),score=62.34 TRINITY_DN65454_c0_g1_i1:86-1177(+)